MIDWHCHILPGIDDGPATMDEAVKMAVAIREAGFREIYCTPHLIKGCYDADNGTVRKEIIKLQRRLDELGIELRLHPGREYYMDEYLLEYLKDSMPLGNTIYILVEVPDHMSPENIKESCYRIKCSGFTPMIAHPERCFHFNIPDNMETGIRKIFNALGSPFKGSETQRPSPGATAVYSLLNYLRDIGCAFQGNLGSFGGIYGERVRRSAGRLREMGIYSHLGSDLHSAEKMKVIAKHVEPMLDAIMERSVQP